MPAHRRRVWPPARASACTRTCRKCCSRWPGVRCWRTCSTLRVHSEPAAVHVVYGHGGDHVRSVFPDDGSHLGAAGRAARHRPCRVPSAARNSRRSRRSRLLRRRAARAPCDVAAAARSLVGRPSRARHGRGRRPGGLRPRRARCGAAKSYGSWKTRTPTTRSAPSPRSIRGCFAAARASCAAGLPKLTNCNAQGEYYLTDVIGVAVGRRHPGSGHRRRRGSPRCSA